MILLTINGWEWYGKLKTLTPIDSDWNKENSSSWFFGRNLQIKGPNSSAHYAGCREWLIQPFKNTNLIRNHLDFKVQSQPWICNNFLQITSDYPKESLESHQWLFFNPILHGGWGEGWTFLSHFWKCFK